MALAPTAKYFEGNEPLELIEFVKSDDGAQTKPKLLLRHDNLERVLNSCGGDLPLSIFAICGLPRKGKSILLNYIMRGLEALENGKSDWMDWPNKLKPLKGFKFRLGEKPITKAIRVWSRPFRVKMEDGTIINVLLVDTPGIHDDRISSKEVESAIVGLSLLMSSVMIFNVFTDLEESLANLETYVQHGALAEEVSGNGKPEFQKLVFLMRDWPKSPVYNFGTEGGNKFLQKKLAIRDWQPKEVNAFRLEIQNCFQKLEGFLMPHIGANANRPEFNGSVSELGIDFARNLEEFITNQIKVDNIPIKHIHRNSVKTADLRLYLEAYVNLFNRVEQPSASEIFEATSRVYHNIHSYLALEKYSDSLRRKQWGKQYYPEAELLKAHAESEQLALDYFDRKKCGTFTETQRNEILARIQEIFENAKRENVDKRLKFITEACSDAMTDYRERLEEAKARVTYEFQVKLANETGENKEICMQTLNNQLDAVLVGMSEKNKSLGLCATKDLDESHEAVSEPQMSTVMEKVPERIKRKSKEQIACKPQGDVGSSKLKKQMSIREDRNCLGGADDGKFPVQNQSSLIFRISYGYVAIGTVLDGSFQVIPNEAGKPSIPFVVGVNRNMELVHGTQAMEQCDSTDTCWWIPNLLGNSNFHSCQKRVQFRRGESHFAYEMSLEFLLGYLMRSLKDHAENQFNRCFSTVVITIPYWICSTKRIQVKDAGIVAGFSEVYLINEESVLALALASSSILRANYVGYLLVLSENFGIISAILYSYSGSGGHHKKIRMIGESHSNSQSETTRKGFGKWFMKQVKTSLSLLGNAADEEINFNGKVDLVRQICAKTLDAGRSRDSNAFPGDVVFLTDSEHVQGTRKEWVKAFTSVVKECGYGRVSEDGSCERSMLGASMISPLKIGEQIKDALAHDAFKSSSGFATPIISKEEIFLLSEKSKLREVELEKMAKDVKFYQINPVDGKEVPFGRLELGKSISNMQQSYPTFELSNEAVVTLKEVRVDPVPHRRYQRKELTRDYAWTTPNLTERQKNDVKEFIHSLMQHDDVGLEAEGEWEKVEAAAGENLEERISALVKTSQEVEQGLKDDKYFFKTDISKELVQKKIDKANNLCEIPIAQLSSEDIQRMQDALKKVDAKYSKK